MATDEPTILRTMALDSDNGAYEKWGLHLSDEELAELNRRDATEVARAPVAAAVMNTGLSEEDAGRLALKNEEWMGESYAGSWIDQQDGGRIKVAIRTGDGFEEARARAEGRSLMLFVMSGLTRATLRSSRSSSHLRRSRTLPTPFSTVRTASCSTDSPTTRASSRTLS